MPLRFGKRYQNSDGNTIVIGFIQDDEAHELLGLTVEFVKKICLGDDYSDLSIWTIIAKAIYECTGESLVKRDYQKNPFYQELESAIWHDPRYQSAKKARNDERAKSRLAYDNARREADICRKRDNAFWRRLDKKKKR